MDLLVFNFYEWQRTCYQIPRKRDKYKTCVRDKYKTVVRNKHKPLEELGEREMEEGRRKREVGREWETERGKGGWWKEGVQRNMGTGQGAGWENSQETGLKSNEKRPLLLSAIKAITGYPL